MNLIKNYRSLCKILKEKETFPAGDGGECGEGGGGDVPALTCKKSSQGW